MSAIAGILYFDGAPVEPGLIQKLTGAMAKRGPDEQTHWVNGSVALGHCMLRTTPESLREHQPLMSLDKNLALVWDGRLDNRDELRRNLRSSGTSLRDNTDAELVLQSYVAWGEECSKRLLGDFAFTVWDARQKQLFCARDHVGARPFYYVSSKHFFAFASEDEPFLQLPGVSRQFNEELIASLLVPAFDSFDNNRSWLWDVLILLPGQYMTVTVGGTVRIKTYWQIEPGEERVFASDVECQEAFLDVFGEAVRCRMRTRDNIAAMMSGGLDSAGIAAMVKRLSPEMTGKEFHTYSAISDNPEDCIESRCILSLTQSSGTNTHRVSIPSFTGMVSVEDLIKIAWTKTHPVDNSILLPMLMLLAASRDGHRVMLHGVSGDMAMYVPPRYIGYLLRNRQWQCAWNECKGVSKNNTYQKGIPAYRLLLSNLRAAYLPESYRLSGEDLSLEQSVINQDFALKLQLSSRLHLQGKASSGSLADSVQQAHVRSLGKLGDVLGVTGYERAAGRFSIELRDPWADRRVLEFFLNLPLKYKIRDGWTKYLVRTAFVSELECDMRQRTGKEHLGWQFTARLMDETAEFVSQTMAQSLEVLGDYADVDSVQTRYEEYIKSRDMSELQFLYEIMTLLLWARRITG